jgi:hypothetical protein
MTCRGPQGADRAIQIQRFTKVRLYRLAAMTLVVEAEIAASYFAV